MNKTTTALALIALLATTGPAHAQEAWDYREGGDAMTDAVMRYAYSSATKGTAMLAFRCPPDNGYFEVAVLAKYKVPLGRTSIRYLLAHFRVDGGTVHELILRKQGPNRYVSHSTDADPRPLKVINALRSDIENGKRLVMRLTERSDHEDYVFETTGATAALASLDCRGAR